MASETLMKCAHPPCECLVERSKNTVALHARALADQLGDNAYATIPDVSIERLWLQMRKNTSFLSLRNKCLTFSANTWPLFPTLDRLYDLVEI